MNLFAVAYVVFTAKVRRLYDIANILCSLRLIEKVHHHLLLLRLTLIHSSHTPLRVDASLGSAGLELIWTVSLPTLSLPGLKRIHGQGRKSVAAAESSRCLRPWMRLILPMSDRFVLPSHC